MQNFEIGFVSTKLGESFNSKSASNSRFVRAMNCRALFPVTTNAVLAESKFAASRNRFVFSAPQSPLSVLIMRTSSFLIGRTCEKRMKSRISPFLQRNENVIHQSGIRPSRQRVLLRFAHLRGSDHLHRFGDLRGVADRFDPAPYVLRVRH